LQSTPLGSAFLPTFLTEFILDVLAGIFTALDADWQHDFFLSEIAAQSFGDVFVFQVSAVVADYPFEHSVDVVHVAAHFDCDECVAHDIVADCVVVTFAWLFHRVFTKASVSISTLYFRASLFRAASVCRCAYFSARNSSARHLTSR
jgi:hypothetical protein